MSELESYLDELKINVAEAQSYLSQALLDVDHVVAASEENTYALEQWEELVNEGYTEASDIIQYAELGASLSSDGYEDADSILEALEVAARMGEIPDVLVGHPLTADIRNIYDLSADADGLREVLNILSKRVEKSSSNADAVVAAIRLLVEALADVGIQAGTVSDPGTGDNENGSPVDVASEPTNNQPTSN